MDVMLMRLRAPLPLIYTLIWRVLAHIIRETETQRHCLIRIFCDGQLAHVRQQKMLKGDIIAWIIITVSTVLSVQ